MWPQTTGRLVRLANEATTLMKWASMTMTFARSAGRRLVSVLNTCASTNRPATEMRLFHPRVFMVALLCIFIVLPSAMNDLATVVVTLKQPPAGDSSPGLDSFLASVRTVTSPHARIVVASSSPALVFYRSTYLLYPRRIFPATGRGAAWPGKPPSPHHMTQLARARNALYVLVWGFNSKFVGSRSILKRGQGILVRV